MLQLIETICYEEGFFQRIPLHEERMNRSRHHFLGEMENICLESLLNLPEELKKAKIKCRIIYSNEIESIEYELYKPRLIRSLKLVYDDTIDYSFKYKARDSLNQLLKIRGNADEILIVQQGLITDTSFSNIVFLKEEKWFTPESQLLPGTRRQAYLQDNTIIPRGSVI